MDSKKNSHSSNDGKNEEKKILNFGMHKQSDISVDETQRIHFQQRSDMNDIHKKANLVTSQPLLKLDNMEDKQNFTMSLANMKDFKKEFTDENINKIRNTSINIDNNQSNEMFRPYVA